MEIKFRTLRADEVECRVATVKQNGCSVLLFKDARVDQNILDEAVGMENWQRKHELIDGQLFCSVGIRVKHDDGITEWIWKQDVGVESYTEKEKGRASDSFKRACFNVGIGRELYTAPFIWIGSDMCHIQPKGQGYTTYDTFKVAEIGYDENRRISHLVITNKGKKVFEMGSKPVRKSEPPKKAEPKAQDTGSQTISKTKALAIKAKCDADGVDAEKLLAAYKVKSFMELTEEKHTNMIQFWDKVMATYGK